MLMLLALLAIVIWIGKKFGDSAGVIALSLLILLVIVMLVIAGKENTNAWHNRTRYWAMSGKDRAKARHKWEAEARAEEEREKARRRAKEARKPCRRM